MCMKTMLQKARQITLLIILCLGMIGAMPLMVEAADMDGMQDDVNTNELDAFSFDINYPNVNRDDYEDRETNYHFYCGVEYKFNDEESYTPASYNWINRKYHDGDTIHVRVWRVAENTAYPIREVSLGIRGSEDDKMILTNTGSDREYYEGSMTLSKDTTYCLQVNFEGTDPIQQIDEISVSNVTTNYKEYDPMTPGSFAATIPQDANYEILEESWKGSDGTSISSNDDPVLRMLFNPGVTYQYSITLKAKEDYIFRPFDVMNISVNGMTVGQDKQSGNETTVTLTNIFSFVPTHIHDHNYRVTPATLSKNGNRVDFCSGCDAMTVNTPIYYPKTISLSKNSYVYNGKVIKPSVSIKDAKGKIISASNYTISYPNGCKNIGTYSITILFKGNYTGKTTRTFTINPPAPTLSKLKSPKSKTMKVTWSKNTMVTGYQIQYSTNKNFSKAKTLTITKNATVSKSIGKLTKKKTYYVRVRSYKTISGKNYYSAFSAPKSIKIK